MKWFDRWFYKQAKKAWEMKDHYEESERGIGILERNMKMGTALVERGRSEGEDRISFELSTAVGGRILNVRRYDERKDRHDSQTYVIPNGEDVGERVAKILNLELIK
jgi:hypothetical protein